MLITQAPDIRSSEITNERVYRNRRQFIRAASGAAMGAVAATTVLGEYQGALHAQEPIPNLVKSPLSTSDELNSYDDITSYNNFYEFGTDKGDPQRYADELTTSPWSVRVEGEMNKPAVDMDIDDLLRPPHPRRAYLPPAVRRGLVDGGAVGRVPAGRPDQAFRANLEG